MGAKCNWCQSENSFDRRRLVHDHRRVSAVNTTESGGEFRDPYLLKGKQTVIIRHSGGGNIRIDPTGLSTSVSGNGGNGPFSQFEAIPGPDGRRLRLRSVHNRKWLRIDQTSNGKYVVNCSGVGGEQDILRAHYTADSGHYKLESEFC